MERAYRGLGHSHKRLGNLQQALVCFEKRLVVAHELNNPEAKASAYGELGHIHTTLGNYEQAISCLEHQLAIARYTSHCTLYIYYLNNIHLECFLNVYHDIYFCKFTNTKTCIRVHFIFFRITYVL